MPTLCIHWPRLGPYHIARLRDLTDRAGNYGTRIIALEITSDDSVYEWRVERASVPFDRHTVFEQERFHKISPRRLHYEVMRKLDELKPDAVAIHSYSFPDARACLYWCKTRGKAAIMMIDSKADDAARRPAREWIKTNLVTSYDAALVAGQPQKRYMESLGIAPDRIRDGYNVIDNRFFADRAAYFRSHTAEATVRPGLTDPRPFFLASNRFIRRKNLDGLIKAYHSYRAQTSAPWRLILLGDGPERPRLEGMISELGVDDVAITGFRQLEDLPAYYALASAFIHPARQDMWGLVVNEAMACGLPVLVSEQAGCAEDLVHEGENGYVFSWDDTETLVKRMLNVSSLTDPQLKEKGEASRRIIAEWDLDRFSTNLLDLFNLTQEMPRTPLKMIARATIKALIYLAAKPDSFHAIPEEKAK